MELLMKQPYIWNDRQAPQIHTMKTPEQIAAETAAEFCTYTRQVDSTEEKLTSLILAALTEHAAQTQDELTALRAVADEMEGALKDFSAMMSESLGIAGYHRNGDVYTWDEGDDPLRAKTDAALTRYAALRAGEKGAV